MNKVYIGLGSNVEDREKYLLDAIELLEKNESIQVVKKSFIYETPPVGYHDQDDFLNMVIKVMTSLTSIELLNVCQDIEQQLGRERTVENGPRTVDLDILLFNKENRDLDRLRIPHPRLQKRAFVLIPLYDIAPNLVMPDSGKHIEDLINNISNKELKGVVKWEKSK